MHYVYILYSPILNKYYVGESNDVEKRLIQHNTAFYKGSYTSITNDWILKSSICFNSSSAAKKAEAFIKKMNSRRFVESLILKNQWLIDKFNSTD